MESCNLISKINEEKNQLKSAIRYENIKADYFLEKVFNNLKKGKTLNIVKYNENIKRRINININDYKEYSEKYSSIEIEIKPVSNKYGSYILCGSGEGNVLIFNWDWFGDFKDMIKIHGIKISKFKDKWPRY